MQQTISEQKLEQLLSPILEKEGFEIVSLKVMALNKNNLLQLMIENINNTPIKLDDCAKISHKIEPVIEASDLLNEDFQLEVGSAGIERPLTKLKDFVKFKNQMAKLKLSHAIEESKNILGTIKDVQGNIIQIQTEEQTLAIEFDNIKKANLKKEINFK